MIRFHCSHCRTNLRIPAREAGRLAKCPSCNNAQAVPYPGLKSVRRQCTECGTEHDMDHGGPCDSCGLNDFRLLCTTHKTSLDGSLCKACLEDYERQLKAGSVADALPPMPTAELCDPPKPPLAGPALDKLASVKFSTKVMMWVGIGGMVFAFGLGGLVGLIAGGLAVWQGLMAFVDLRTAKLPRAEWPKVAAAMVCGDLAVFLGLVAMFGPSK